MNFFFDNMMSPKLAKMIRIFTEGEHRISHIRDDPRFRHSTEDQVWVSELAKDAAPWSVISGDLRMIQNPTILAIFKHSNLIFFCMDDNWCSGNTDHSQVWKFFRLWPDLVAHSRGSAPAFYQVNTVKDRPTIEELKFSRRARRRRLNL
jgi:hypothetical protein